MKRLLGATTLLVLAAASGSAQSPTGSILGVVKDQSGGILPGVTITATEVDTNQSRIAISNDQGYYEAGFLPPGNYTVRAGLAGFKNVVLKGIILQVGQKAKVDVTLGVGDISEQVTVEGVAPLLQAAEATVGQVINRRSVQQLPLNGRQFMSLALLVPGVTNVVGGGNQSRGTAQIAQFAASGSREDANVFTLDGAVNTDSEFHHFVVSPNPDEIQEFKVNTNSYSAEQGYNSGAQISIVTRSGGNRFHGSVYEFHRNSALDAKNFFDRPAPAPITPFKRNQFGGTFGGPIVRDRTFFFLSYEGLRIRQSQTSTVTVPNATLRGGDFRGRRPIFDPLSLKADPSSPTGFIREPFPNNVIPSSRISPQAIALLKYTDLPNLTPTAAQAAVNVASYLDARSLEQDHNQWAVRGDHRLSDKDTIFARYTQTIEDQFRPGAFTSVSTNFRPRGRIFALGYTRVLSGTSVNDLTLSATRLRVSRVSGNAFGPPLQTQAGLKGFEASDPVVYGIPSQSVAGAGMTLAGDIDPQVYRNNYIQAADQFSRTFGKHTLKWGGSFINMQLNDRTDRFGNGAFAFDGRWTNDASGRITASGDAFADMLLGALFVSDKTSGNFQVYLRRKAYGLYIQDDWRMTSNLTVNVGLRYDYSNPWVEKYDRFGGIHAPNFTGLPEPVFIQAGKDGWPRGIVDPDRNNFAPRLGLAYRPRGSNRTAIRVGYGIFYNKDIGNTIVDFVRNFPFTVRERRITGSVTVPNPPYTLADPFPSGQPLSQTRGIFGQRTPSTPDATVQNWNLTLQRLFLKDLAVEVAYVGSTGRKLPFAFSKNYPLPGPGDIQSRRPWPSLAAFQYAAPFANSFYHAFQAKVEKRYSGGLTLLSSLTLSKSIDDGMSIRTTSGSDLKSEYDIVGSNRGRSGFDQRQRFVTSVLYDLPVGRGKGRLDSGFVGGLLGGWQVGGIGTFSSGFPFTIRSGFDRANNGVAGLQSPDPVPGVDYQLPADQRDPARWLNPAGLQIQRQYTLGLLGRNTAQGPGLQVIDLLVSKATTLAEGHKIDFRAEFFNLLNHPNFDLPGANFAGTSTFGVIQSAGASRQVQFGLRYEF